MSNAKSKIEDVRIDRLIVDTRVQRSSLDQKKVDRIVSNFNFDALGVVCLSHRESGKYSIVDGQHRIAALRQLGFATDVLQCEVFTGLTLADEAAMFRLRNNTTQVQYLDKFRVRTIEGDAVALRLEKILHEYGWKLGVSSKDRNNGRISAIQALERVYRMDAASDPTPAELTIQTITRAWGHSGYAVDGRIITGLGMFFVRFADQVDLSDLSNRLAKFPGGPNGMIGKARGLAGFLGTHVKHAIAEIITEEYNKRRRATQLPSWRTA